MRVPSFIAAAFAATFVPTVAAAPWTLEQALDRAEQHSQSIRAARSGVAGAVEMARAAGRLPDPVLRAGIENLPVTGADRYSSNRDFMTMKRIGLSQEWLSADRHHPFGSCPANGSQTCAEPACQNEGACQGHLLGHSVVRRYGACQKPLSMP